MMIRFIPRAVLALLGVCLWLGLAGSAWAQGEGEESVEPNFTMAIDEVRALSIDDTSVDFSPGPEEVLAGWTGTPYPQVVVTVFSNDNWALKISAPGDGGAGKWAPGTRNKSVADLKWGTSGTPNTAMTVSPVTVQSSSNATDEDGQPVTVLFRVRLINSNTNNFDRPDNYSLNVVLDITDQS